MQMCWKKQLKAADLGKQTLSNCDSTRLRLTFSKVQFLFSTDERHHVWVLIYPRLGSIGIPDDRFKGFQAIICTEVIEHVYADVLDQFLDLTLGIYHPAILVVTTPNAEYNVNFPDLKYGTPDASFRHDDHKFEWTRKEFQSW